MAKPLLDIEHLTVDFITERGKLTAISDLSLHINPGETVCLVGESGSGKTITSKAVMRLIDYENGVISGGTIRLGDDELTSLPQERMRRLRGKKLSMVFQEPMAAFDPVFTIGSQIVDVIVRHTRQGKSQASSHAIGLLRRVGIPEPELRMKQYPGELSGGMLQRAMIAMALACGPELLIADEPTTALDVTIQAQILQLLQELKAEYNMSILLITHDLGVASEIADRIVVMYAGKIVEQAPARELFERPLHPYTQGLLQSVTTLDTCRGSKLHAIEGAIPSLSALPSGCRFHPRCPYATEVCASTVPPLEEKEGREVACWHIGAGEAGYGAAAREEAAEVLLLGSASAGEEQAEHHAAASEAASGSTGAGNTAPVPAYAEVEERLFLHALADPSLRPPVAGEPASQSGSSHGVEGHEARLPLFEVKGLSKMYALKGGLLQRSRKAIRAVDDVSFSIEQGETFGLVGESGSGKSTLGRMLLQLEPATGGQVLFQGQELSVRKSKTLRDARRDMQVIFQDPYGSLNPRWKIGDIIGEPLLVHEGLTGRAKRLRVEELLTDVGLSPSLYDRYPHEFSGGQRQRIGIARAIALRPKFILADEAVSALDVSVQAQIVNLLQDLQQRLGLTYLFIGHGLHVVRHISDRIGVMYLGKLVEIAPSEELFLRPAHPYTQALIASIPQPGPGRVRERISLQGEIPSPANPPSGCRFHPRCPAATSKCREQQPDWQQIGSGHWAACHYPR
ncbi:dipeptide ABC transporter ATP-binding protein [Paenibacillus filicis]|uniref:Dipeptide ABC transporter ATP-binding protein n=1 Tax=Paenibacillus filicis TaxID=669464 RepID=A0ABU9DK63_9BACL